MARPARSEDPELGAELRHAMASVGLSAADVATMAGVSRATVHRALKDHRFSGNFALSAKTIAATGAHDGTATDLLRKSLHLLELSDRLRIRAESMIVLALDQSARIK